MRRTLKYHPLDVAQQCVAQKYGAEKYFSSNAPKRSRPRGILIVFKHRFHKGAIAVGEHKE